MSSYSLSETKHAPLDSWKPDCVLEERPLQDLCYVNAAQCGQIRFVRTTKRGLCAACQILHPFVRGDLFTGVRVVNCALVSFKLPVVSPSLARGTACELTLLMTSRALPVLGSVSPVFPVAAEATSF